MRRWTLIAALLLWAAGCDSQPTNLSMAPGAPPSAASIDQQAASLSATGAGAPTMSALVDGKDCGEGYCKKGRYCDACGCLPATHPLSEGACRCNVIDETCGRGTCAPNGGYCDGAHCDAPVCYPPDASISLSMCQNLTTTSPCETIAGCGGGKCVGGSFCDHCQCYSPDSPISRLACDCDQLNPACGLGSCLDNGGYCEGGSCGAPVCYEPSHPTSQAMCQQVPIDKHCKVSPVTCGKGTCVKGQYCDNCHCYNASHPLSQLACKCDKLDESCGEGTCLENGAYCDGPHCDAPACYEPLSLISQAMCQGLKLTKGCKPTNDCGTAACGNGQWCDACGCLPVAHPLSALACECEQINPQCGKGECLANGAYCTGAHCSDPVCYAPSSPISAAICQGAPVACAPGAACVTPPSQLRAWWTFDESAGPTANDAAGSNDGTHIGGPTPGPGKVAGALRFDGLNDKVQASLVGPPHQYHNLTIDAWIRLDSTAGTQTVVDFGDLTYTLIIEDGEIRLVWQPQYLSWSGISTNANLVPNQWVFIAVAVNTTGQCRFYVNGALVDTIPSPVVSGSWPGNLWTIGDGPGGPLSGDIDELEIFERTLSTAEIQSIYAAGSAGKCKPDPDPTDCGPGECIGGSFCDSCLCYAPEHPVSQLFCACGLADPACGLGKCIDGLGYCEGPHCDAPVCYEASNIIYQVLCEGAPVPSGCEGGCVEPPAGMRAWWSLDETAGVTSQDLAGDSDGTHQNGPTPAAGKVAGALRFDGVNDRVWAPLIGSHSYHNLTIDAWIHPDSVSGDPQTIIEFENFLYALILDGDELTFVWQPQFISFAPTSTSMNIPAGQWTFVAVTVTQNGTLRFFKNGALVETMSLSAVTGSWSGTGWSIGSGSSNSGPFAGRIDEVEIFEHALSPAEIDSIWQAGADGKCKPEPSADCGPGMCTASGSFCDGCQCYEPEHPYSQLFCACGLADPACGIGECIDGVGYCEGPYCEAPVCYDSSSIIYQVICEGQPVPENCGDGCTNPPSDLRAWWPFDETNGTLAEDIAGNSDGTHSGGPIPLTGKVAGALRFDGINDSVVAPTVGATHQYHNLTIDAWVYPDTVTGYHPIVEYGGFLYELAIENGELRFVWQPMPLSMAPISTGMNIQPGEWTFIAASVSDQGEFRFYKNGVLTSSVTLAAVTGSWPSSTWTIGESFGDHYQGRLDELEIFERVLAPSEIANLFAADEFGKCKPKTPPDCGPGTCIGGGYCDSCICYEPEHPISQVFCGCKLADPACGLGECIPGVGYCEGPHCDAPVCYDATSMIYLAICEGQPLPIDCGPTTGQCVKPPATLHAWWPFDEATGPTAVDIAGSNNGTHLGGPVPVAGKVANALRFDGSDDVVDAVQVGTHTYHNLTIDAWIFPEQVTGSHTIVEHTTYLYSLNVEDGELRFVWQPQFISFAPISTNMNLVANEWAFVAITVTQDGILRFFKNGNLVESMTLLPVDGSWAGNGWEIGNGLDGPFRGIIDELEIFERALAPGELAKLYSADSAGKCKPAIAPDCGAGSCIGGSYCDSCQCYSPDHPYSYVFCECGLADPACGIGECIEPIGGYCTGANCDAPVCYEPSSLVSKILCGGMTPPPNCGDVAVCVEPPADLRAWWPLDKPEGLMGELVSGSVASPVGTVTAAPGMVAGARRFGAGFGIAPVVGPPHKYVNLTIDAWVWVEPGTAGMQPIVSFGQGLYIFAVEDGELTLVWQPAPVSYVRRTEGAQIPSGEWVFVAVTISAEGVLRFYSNGDIVGSFVLEPSVTSVPGAEWMLGQAWDYSFHGLLDEVEIFERALKPGELKAIYAAGPGGKCKPTGGTAIDTGISGGAPSP